MAATTLKAIIDRFQAVIEGADLNYRKSAEEFSFDLQPNAKLNKIYRIEDSGLGETRSISNQTDARVDVLSVWVARKATPDSQQERETLETDLLTIERKLVADGPGNSYHTTIEARELERVGDVIMAQLQMAVDYDVSLT